jgi:hypothetical protein
MQCRAPRTTQGRVHGYAAAEKSRQRRPPPFVPQGRQKVAATKTEDDVVAAAMWSCVSSEKVDGGSLAVVEAGTG